MYKIETHLHTSEVSVCSQIRAEEMIKLYHQAEYSTIIVSDHFPYRSLGKIPWEEQTAIFLSGYYKAKVAGRKYGMNVIPAAEITFAGSPNDYLAYGISKAFLDAYPYLHEMKIEEFAPIAKENNVLLIQAHPYRDNNCYPTPEYVDGIEVYNGNPRHNDFNDKSEQLALDCNLLMTAGSDAHRLEDIGRGGMLSEYEIKTAEDFIALVKSRKAELIKEMNV